MVESERSHGCQTSALGSALDVQNGANRTHRLPRDRDRGHPRQRGERFEPRRDILERVRVQGSRAAIVPGIERGEEFAQFGAATFAEHEPVGAHPQGFADESFESESARPLEIGLPRLETEEMRMPHPQFRDILDRDDSFQR